MADAPVDDLMEKKEAKEEEISDEEEGEDESTEGAAGKHGEDTEDLPAEAEKEGAAKSDVKPKEDKEDKDDIASEEGMTSGDLLSDEDATKPKGEKREAEDGTGVSAPVIIITVLALILAVGVALRPAGDMNSPNATHNYYNFETFREKLSAMKSEFPNQYDVYWNMLRNGGKKHLKKVHSVDATDVKPQAYLIAGYAGSSKTLNCFVSRLAASFTDGHETLDSADFMGNEEDRAQLFDAIMAKLGGSNKLLIVNNIEKLQFKVAQLFMSFADSHNSVASYPQSMILFTTELPFSHDVSRKRVSDEGEAGNHFKNVVWAGAHVDQTAPLWSRVGDGLMLIKNEDEIPLCN